MLTSVEGVYKDGKVELTEHPDGILERRVIVTFLEKNGNGATATSPQKDQMIYKGMFKGDYETTEEDFKIAEFHGDPDDGLDWLGLEHQGKLNQEKPDGQHD